MHGLNRLTLKVVTIVFVLISLSCCINVLYFFFSASEDEVQISDRLVFW